ncbi:hypothetical protein [Scrofimicrobium canadense]|nr:hypothetical protein [Scrofimicrobium canadense]
MITTTLVQHREQALHQWATNQTKTNRRRLAWWDTFLDIWTLNGRRR